MSKDLIIMHDPGISSFNIGDEIISDSIKYELSDLLEKHSVLSVSTHLPLAYRYMRLAKKPIYQFVCGSNLLKSSFMGIKRQWDIKLRNAFYINDCIFVGVGAWQYNNKMNHYSKILLKQILSSSYYHSVRDNYTKSILNKLGFQNVINTGCATMWRFTPDFCKLIPNNKSQNVVCTLTDYNKDPERDQYLLEQLLSEYSTVYFFPQGKNDIEYIKQLNYFDKVVTIAPSLYAYDKLLSDIDDIEFVGTRLHGGIRALQHKKRALIISIDNRAREISKDHKLPILERDNIDNLVTLINSEINYDIHIPIKEINMWKDQFVK